MRCDRQSTLIHVKELNGVGTARRHSIALAHDLGFDETEAGKVGIVATEIASNLVKHAGGGQILLRILHRQSHQGLEIMSLDNGRGMENVSRNMQDGYSTAGSPGSGLGAMGRLSNELSIYSQPAKGTVISTTFWAKAPTDNPKELMDIGAVCIPVEGETECGDSWCVRFYDNKTKILVVDGLGHGVLAAEAAKMAVDTFDEHLKQTPGLLMQTLNGALLTSRGAAVAIAEIDHAKDELTFCGIGNIAGVIISNQKGKGLASLNGTVGLKVTKAKEFTAACPQDALIIFHSDGLNTRWKVEDYPGLLQRSCSVIAGILYRDFTRGRDDTTVLVLRKP